VRRYPSGVDTTGRGKDEHRAQWGRSPDHLGYPLQAFATDAGGIDISWFSPIPSFLPRQKPAKQRVTDQHFREPLHQGEQQPMLRHWGLDDRDRQTVGRRQGFCLAAPPLGG
jgi:hypothetical protein